jgi:hypothetical protein
MLFDLPPFDPLLNLNMWISFLGAGQGSPQAGCLSGRRPIIWGRLIAPLLIRSLLGWLIIPLWLRLIVRGLRTAVGCPSYATSDGAEQAADSRPTPGITVVDGGPQSGPQDRTQTRTRVKVGVLTGCGASGEKAQAQKTQENQPLSQASAPKSLSWLHDTFLPKGLIGPFDYLEAPRRKMLRQKSSLPFPSLSILTEIMQLPWPPQSKNGFGDTSSRV